MPPRPTINVMSIVDLPSVIQSVAGQRRSGVLVVRSDEAERRLHFRAGQLVAISGGPRGLVRQALGWSRVIAPQAISDRADALGGDPAPHDLLAKLRGRGELSDDALLDVLAMCAEEDMTTTLSWPAPTFDLLSEVEEDPWAQFQIASGVSLNPSALLLEALRRQDERSTFGELVPDPMDVVRRESEVEPTQSDEDQALVLEACANPILCRIVLAHPLLQPHRALRALVELRRLGALRVVSAAELSQLGEQARERGKQADAYGMLSRALALGHDGARIREHLANLAEELGDKVAAAAHCLAAVPFLQTPQAMILALRHVLRLGAEQEGPLTQLVALNLTVGDDRATLEALLSLVRLYESRGDRQRAIEALGEAQSLGADKVVTAKMMARLAVASGDIAQASIQLEQAARLATEQNRNDEAIEAWQALLQLRPDRLGPARACAELLDAAGRRQEAVRVLRQTLDQAASAPEEIQLVAWEMYAKLDPNSAAAHDWLAKIYAKRRDRDGATLQLRLVADAQEHHGDDNALIETLGKIIEFGGEDVELLHRMANAHDRLGLGAPAIDAWCRASDLAIEAGKLDQARQILANALERTPFSADLRWRDAELALREGDSKRALVELRRAADLANGSGDVARTKELLQRLCSLRPDDLVPRLRLCEALRGASDPDEHAVLDDALRVAIRGANFGIAVELATSRTRIATPANRFQAHAELVELLRRAGDAAGERAAAQALLDDLLEAGHFDRAVELLSRLFAAHPRDPDFAVQLAELHSSLDDTRMAARFLRHAVQLLQAEGRLDEARSALVQLEQVSDDDLLIAAARKRLAAGEAVEWDQLRSALEHGQRRGLVDKLGSEMIRR